MNQIILTLNSFNNEITRLQKLNALFEESNKAAKIGVWEVDLIKDTVFWSATTKKIHGVEDDYTPTLKEAFDFIKKDDYHLQLLSSFNEAIANGKGYEMDVKIIRKDGYELWTRAKGTPEFKDNICIRIYGTFQDIQEQKDREEAYLKTQEELSQFSTIVSHDLKEPLRMINQFMQKIDQKYSGSLDEKARQYIYYAVDGAKRMSKMIDELLNYSKLTDKDKTFEIIHTNSLVEEILKGAEQLLLEKNIKVDVKDLPDIIGNLTSIKVLFNNLINNAIKYADTSKTPTVKISGIAHPTEWEFSIEDNGIGIDPEYHDKIFELFYKINKYKDENCRGIGLAICKKIVSLHKGNIKVASNLGEGSKFYFTIKKQAHA